MANCRLYDAANIVVIAFLNTQHCAQATWFFVWFHYSHQPKCCPLNSEVNAAHASANYIAN